MRIHVDVLGWLHLVWGAFAVLAGSSLEILAAGGRVAMFGLPPDGGAGQAAIWLCVLTGGVLLVFGFANAGVGRWLHRRLPRGRTAALLLGVLNLVLVPFGTALGVYTYWVLLNDDVRRQFGRPERAQPQPLPAGGTS